MSEYRSHPNSHLRRWRFDDDVQNCSLYYRIMRAGCQAGGGAFFHQRVYNRHFEPADGGVVYIANHQSFFDPILVTNALCRPGNYMARDTLFRNPWFRRLIESVNAFPIKRNKADTGALKEAMRRLKHGRTVVIFPEGTRTRDGHIGPFLPGVSVLAQRAAKWTVPVLIDGAFEVWPRTRVLPRPGKIYVEYAPPIPCEEAKKYTPEEFVQKVRGILIDMQTRLRAKIGKPTLRYD
jgi:1-acyl-sn-glycerol-3-phosphate acyltransferase